MTKQQIEFHKKCRKAERERVLEIKDGLEFAGTGVLGLALAWVLIVIMG